jgi:hypothetical protein
MDLEFASKVGNQLRMGKKFGKYQSSCECISARSITLWQAIEPFFSIFPYFPAPCLQQSQL